MTEEWRRVENPVSGETLNGRIGPAGARPPEPALMASLPVRNGYYQPPLPRALWRLVMGALAPFGRRAVRARLGTGWVGRTRRPGGCVLTGGLCGFAWAAGLRGFMTQVTDVSSVTWSGTFLWVLLPGFLIGVLLGWAEYLRQADGARQLRWLALAPLLFAAVLFSKGPLGALAVFEDGLGGGAIGVPLLGMAGGYALSRSGPLAVRLLAGLVALAAVPIWAFTVQSFAGPALAVTTPRGRWVALYFYSFLAVLALACAIPHRPAPAPTS